MVRSADRPYMTIAVDRDVKNQTKQTIQLDGEQSNIGLPR